MSENSLKANFHMHFINECIILDETLGETAVFMYSIPLATKYNYKKNALLKRWPMIEKCNLVRAAMNTCPIQKKNKIKEQFLNKIK